MDLADILDSAKKITGSDGNTARRLGVSDQAISNWRQKRNTPNNTQCARLAELTGDRLDVVIALAERRRAKTADDVALWERITGKIAATSGTALGALLVAGLMTFSGKADAAAFNISHFATAEIHIVALLRRALQRLFRRHTHAKVATVAPASTYAQAAA